MSLPSKFVSAFSKPHGMQDFSEHHPLLLGLGAIAGLLALLVLITRYAFT